LLLILITFRNRTTGQCNPKRATLAKRLGFGLRTTDKYLAELRGKGLVRSRPTAGRYSSYEIDTAAEWKTAPPEAAGERPESPGRCATSCASGAQDGAPEVRKSAQFGAAVSLYEPTVLQPKVFEPLATAAAAPVAEEVRKLEKPTAAAAVSDDQKSFQHQDRVAVAAPLPVLPPQVRPENAKSEVRQLAQELAQELSATHPKPGLPYKAVEEITRALETSGNPILAAEQMRANHAAWCEYWRGPGANGFIGMLFRWVRDGEWQIKPVVRRPMSKTDLKAEEFLKAYANRRGASLQAC